jgi:hypothetical protein
LKLLHGHLLIGGSWPFEHVLMRHAPQDLTGSVVEPFLQEAVAEFVFLCVFEDIVAIPKPVGYNVVMVGVVRNGIRISAILEDGSTTPLGEVNEGVFKADHVPFGLM